MIAAFLLAAGMARSLPAIRSVEITSLLQAIIVDPPGAGPCHGQLCTRSNHYRFDGNTQRSRAIADALLGAASIPTPRLLHIDCPATPEVLRNLRLHLDKKLYVTDDYPKIWVRITFENGNVLDAYSSSQIRFAVPWTVSWRGQVFRSYDPAVARAIAAVLPQSDYNHTRLTGAWGVAIDSTACWTHP